MATVFSIDLVHLKTLCSPADNVIAYIIHVDRTWWIAVKTKWSLLLNVLHIEHLYMHVYLCLNMDLSLYEHLPCLLY